MEELAPLKSLNEPQGIVTPSVYTEREGVIWRAVLFTSEGSDLMIGKMKGLWFAWPFSCFLPLIFWQLKVQGCKAF